jgi:hypothetical protein
MLWHQVRMPKPITKYRQDIPEGLLRIIECMMAKEPERRYQTPVELAEVLSEFTATPIPPPAVSEMPPMIITTTGRPSSHASRATEPIAQNMIATPSPRRIVPKPPLTGTGN